MGGGRVPGRPRDPGGNDDAEKSGFARDCVGEGGRRDGKRGGGGCAAPAGAPAQKAAPTEEENQVSWWGLAAVAEPVRSLFWDILGGNF